jgi:hypothetical protein
VTEHTTRKNEMALDPAVVALIRDEIGNDTDFSDDIPHASPQLDSLENIYTDTNRGNTNVLRTALICWRRRLFNLQERSFDVITEGSLLSRSQRIKMIERRIKELALLVDTTHKGKNATVLSSAQIDAADGSEFG